MERQREGERIFMDAWQKNMSQIDLVRTVLALVAGALSGIMGLTQWSGLISYVCVSVITGLATAVPMGFEVKKYTNTSLLGLVVQGMQGQAMTFIMTWTLVYSVVYLF